MILFPILTALWAVWVLRTVYRSGEPDTYDNWLKEPNDLELLK